MNPRASSGLTERRKHRGIIPILRVRRLRPDLSGLRRPKAEALREGGLKAFKK